MLAGGGAVPSKKKGVIISDHALQAFGTLQLLLNAFFVTSELWVLL